VIVLRDLILTKKPEYGHWGTLFVFYLLGSMELEGIEIGWVLLN